MTVHRCSLPTERQGSNVWTCPECQGRYIWSKRMIGREVREGWYRATATTWDRHNQRVAQMDAEMRPFFRFAVAAWAVSVVLFLVVVAAAVWIALRVTS